MVKVAATKSEVGVASTTMNPRLAENTDCAAAVDHQMARARDDN